MALVLALWFVLSFATAYSGILFLGSEYMQTTYTTLYYTQRDNIQYQLSDRVCGSPAQDAYTSVSKECLMQSPTFQQYTKPNVALVPHIERHADYDGLAVAWGINNKVANVEGCAQQCMDHKAVENDLDGFGQFPCNAFAFCDADICFEPDAHQHTRGDCWLKFTEAPARPEVNMRGMLPKSMRERHPHAPIVVPWHAGVLLPMNIVLTNGTYSPRIHW